jgi:catechol 2,3-dioxygenase-like lactoylglutathione lyase family enzyme
MVRVLGLDHVQVAIPRGEEDRARSFYGDLLGLREIPKPAPLAGRGGLWFQCGTLQLHLGVEEPFSPARKAHPAFRIHGYAKLLSRLAVAGHAVVPDTSLPKVERALVSDPFGNRVELINGAGAG